MAADNALTFEELLDDCWPAMFEETSEEDVRWLRSVADLVEGRASERDQTTHEDEPERGN
jgi:hypothetical protein